MVRCATQSTLISQKVIVPASPGKKWTVPPYPARNVSSSSARGALLAGRTDRYDSALLHGNGPQVFLQRGASFRHPTGKLTLSRNLLVARRPKQPARSPIPVPTFGTSGRTRRETACHFIVVICFDSGTRRPRCSTCLDRREGLETVGKKGDLANLCPGGTCLGVSRNPTV